MAKHHQTHAQSPRLFTTTIPLHNHSASPQPPHLHKLCKYSKPCFSTPHFSQQSQPTHKTAKTNPKKNPHKQGTNKNKTQLAYTKTKSNAKTTIQQITNSQPNKSKASSSTHLKILSRVSVKQKLLHMSYIVRTSGNSRLAYVRRKWRTALPQKLRNPFKKLANYA